MSGFIYMHGIRDCITLSRHPDNRYPDNRHPDNHHPDNRHPDNRHHDNHHHENCILFQERRKMERQNRYSLNVSAAVEAD